MNNSAHFLQLMASVTIVLTSSAGSAQPARALEENSVALAARSDEPVSWNPPVEADAPGDSPWQGPARDGSGKLVFKSRVRAHWFADSTRFWYRNDLANGRRNFIVVNAVEGIRQEAFDHDRLAKALGDAGVKDVDADRLPVDRLEFGPVENIVTLHGPAGSWQCDLDTYELDKQNDPVAAAEPTLSPLAANEAPTASRDQGSESAVVFVNKTNKDVELFWLDRSGARRRYGRLAPGKSREQHTYEGHVWEAVDPEGTVLAVYEAGASSARAVISGKFDDYAGRTARYRRGRRQDRDASPNGKFTARIQDHNLFLRSDKQESQLTTDGEESNRYGMIRWSPDSKTLVAFRIKPSDRSEVHLVESSPRGGGRTRLRSRPYALPGDEFTTYELSLFNVETGKQIKPDVELVDFGRPRIRWKDDARRFTYEKTDRGHQRFRVMEIDTQSGGARYLIDEKSDTFISNYTFGSWMTNYLAKTDEIIYVSEQDGWRHLYLVDAKEGKISHQITNGEWVVRGIDRIDEDHRQIWFRASGKQCEQDPYFIHYYRINFDGSGLVALTQGDGNHAIRYSPDRKYIIDSYSRVDKGALHELRRAADGALICDLEQADISRLAASGWQPPEVFTAKGRDGKTDIWGIICRPQDFDPAKKYPIIEDIYAGPHNSHVPKSFSASDRYRALTDLGFIVVKIDGMGTANRSKAFHDVCWQNLKDAGFPDRIRWIKAAAEEYPYMDLNRVGIYGVSAGGQNAAGAVLFHPEFYQVAVASCGCHDNRMDKASWNEQWMGYPVGSHYAESSNIENAHRLQGKLLLLVGEMDTNVPPESTMRFADALIKADKDFDLVVLPGAGHTAGGTYGRRRRRAGCRAAEPKRAVQPSNISGGTKQRGKSNRFDARPEFTATAEEFNHRRGVSLSGRPSEFESLLLDIRISRAPRTHGPVSH